MTSPTLTWEALAAGLREAFAGDKVNIDEVNTLMNSYASNRRDWKQYEHFDRHRYTRNLVDEGNGKYNLIVLCWDSGQGSCIHDHANSHCFMKILQGTIRETRYKWPETSEDPQDSTPMEQMDSYTYGTDELTYINNEVGLHRVENPSHTDRAVSLHLYSPPIVTCKSFEERTGLSHECKVTFFCPSSNPESK